MTTGIQFGMLQTVKAKGLNATGPNASQQKQNAQKAESVFQEYEQYKTQLAQAEQNGGETGATQGNTFAQTNMSVDDLQAKMDECVSEFNQYYTAMNNDKEAKPEQRNGENEDDKNKVKPKEFGSMMA